MAIFFLEYVMMVPTQFIKNFGTNSKLRSYKNSMKGGSANAGANVSDKIWLKHSFVHCSVPEVVNLSMAIFFLECVMMVPSPFIKSCQAVDDLWVSLDSAGVPKLRRDYIQKFSCMSLYVYRVRKTMREIFIEERMTRLEWWDDTNLQCQPSAKLYIVEPSWKLFKNLLWKCEPKKYLHKIFFENTRIWNPVVMNLTFFLIWSRPFFACCS